MGGRAKASTLQSGFCGAPGRSRLELKGRCSHSPGTSGDLGGLSVPGLVEEEGPARSPHGTSPAQDSRPQPLPKGNSPTTSCSKNSSGCHLRGERNLSLPPGSPLLTRDWNLMAAATSLKREHLCVPEAGGRAWDATRVHSGIARSCSPILLSRKLRPEGKRLARGHGHSSGSAWPGPVLLNPLHTPTRSGSRICPAGSTTPSLPTQKPDRRHGDYTSPGGMRGPALSPGAASSPTPPEAQQT